MPWTEFCPTAGTCATLMACAQPPAAACLSGAARARAVAQDRRSAGSQATCGWSATTTCRRAAPTSRSSTSRATAGSPTSATTAAPRRAEARQPADRPSRVQRHLDRRRDRSEAAEVPRPHPRRCRATARRAARRWCASATARRCPRATPARPTCCAPSAAWPRNLGRHRSGQARAAHHDRQGPEGHAQELVGMRHRHRLPRLRRAGLALRPHDQDLRPQRSGEAGASSAISAWSARSPARPARCRWSCTAPISTGPQGQPRLFRLRHQHGRRAADRRPREAAQGPEGADAGEPAAIRRSAGSTCCRSTARTPCFPMLGMEMPEFAKDAGRQACATSC